MSDNKKQTNPEVDAMPDMPPLLLRAALLFQIIGVLSLLGIALAIAFEPEEGVSTTNYYLHLFNIPRPIIPLSMLVLAGYGVWGMRLWKRARIVGGVVMAICGLPYLIYCFASTYYLKGVVQSVSNVPIALYWTGAAVYYAMILFLLALGVWDERIRLIWRRTRS